MHLLKFLTISQDMEPREAHPWGMLTSGEETLGLTGSASLKAWCSIPGRLLRGDVQEESEVDLERWTEGRGTRLGQGAFQAGEIWSKIPKSEGIKEHNLATISPDWSEGEVGGLYGERRERLTCAGLPGVKVQKSIFIYYKSNIYLL